MLTPRDLLLAFRGKSKLRQRIFFESRPVGEPLRETSLFSRIGLNRLPEWIEQMRVDWMARFKSRMPLRNSGRRRVDRRRHFGLLAAGQVLEVRQLLSATVSGTVFDDANGNGIQEQGENGLAGQTVRVEYTRTFEADTNDLNKLFRGNQSTSVTITPDTFFTPDAVVANVIVSIRATSEDSVGDLLVSLNHDDKRSSLYGGTSRGDSLHVTFDDNALFSISSAGNSPDGTFIPDDFLSVFDDLAVAGDWLLTVRDYEDETGGLRANWLRGFSLTITYAETVTTNSFGAYTFSNPYSDVGQYDVSVSTSGYLPTNGSKGHVTIGTGGAYYPILDGVQLGVRPDNANEPQGNTLVTAVDLGTLHGSLTVGPNAIAAGGDQDWYKFTLDRPAVYGNGIALEFNQELGDVDIELYDSSGNLLNSDATSTGRKWLPLAKIDKDSTVETWQHINTLPAGTYYVKTFGRSQPTDSAYYTNGTTISDTNAAYILRLDGPGPDAFDQTGNNTPATATNFATFATGTDGTLQISGLSINSSTDVDWFRIQAATPLVETNNWFLVNYDSSLGNLVLELYDSTGTTRLARSNVMGDRLEIRDLAAPASTYLLKVSGSQGSIISNYSLQALYPVTVSNRFDSGDGYGGQIGLGVIQGSGALSNLSQFGWDGDYIGFTTTTTGQAGDYISISFDGRASGSLIDPENNWIDLSTVENSLRISLEGLPAGFHSLSLYAELPSYTVSWHAPTLPHKDWAEMATPRLFRQLGPVLGEQTWNDLSLTSNDLYDAYYFDLTSAGTSSDFARIQFDNAWGDLNLSLYYQPIDQNGNFLQGVPLSKSFSQQNVEQVSLDGLLPGKYLLVVNAASSGGENGDYSLTIHTPPRTRVDRYESNDLQATAANLGNLVGTRTLERLSSTLDGQDVYKIHLTQAGTASDLVRIDFNSAYGDLKLGLFDSNNNLMSASTQMGGRQEVSLTGLPIGDYYVVIQARFAATLIPAYRLTLQGPAATTYNDWSETIDGQANNNSIATATQLGTVRGTNVWSNIALTGSTDQDYFQFTLAEAAVAGQRIDLGLDLSHGDLKLELLNASGAVLLTANELKDLKTVSLEGLAAGTYFIRISGTDFSTAFPYSLRIVAPGGRKNADRFEPNNTRELATDLGAVQTLRTWGTDGAGPLSLDTGSDEDWYKFQLTAEAVLGHFVQINFDSSQGDLSLELYDSTGTLIDSSKTFSNQEWINLKGLGGNPAKTYYLRVFSADGKAQPAYTLTISGPGFDESEGPDTLYATTPSGYLPIFIRPNGSYSASNLSIEPGDTDWFYFQLPATPVEGDAATISFSQLQGDLQLQLYANSPSGSPIRVSNGTGDQERISLAGLSTGIAYFLKISGVDGAQNPNYSLQINTTPALVKDGIDQMAASDDPLVVAAAALYPLHIVQGLYTVHNAYLQNQLSIDSSTDVDWFSFNLSADATASHYVQIAFNQFAGDLDLELYDTTGTHLLGRSATAGSAETISLDGLPAKDAQGNLIEYRVKVFGYNGATNPYYTLTFNTPAPVFSDWAEANNTPAQARDLRGVEGNLSLSNLSLHQAGDVDYFKFQLAAKGILGTGLTLSSDVGYGTLDLTLYDSTGNVVLADSQVYSGTQFVSFANLPAGIYYARVKAANGKSIVPQYSLQFVAPQSKGDWTEDSSTKGDTRQTAYDLQTAKGDLSWSNLSIHNSSDEDWFAFQLEADAVAGHFAQIISSYQLGDIDLQLYDSNGNRLNARNSDGETSNDVEQVSLDGLKARTTYYLRVAGYQGGTQPNYTLRINAPEAGLEGDMIDAVRSNNTISTATPLTLKGGVEGLGDLSIHEAGDVDYFKFKMPETGAVGSQAIINFNPDQGNLLLQLLDSNGTTVLQSSSGLSGSLAVSLASLVTGKNYYVKVSGITTSTTQPNYALTFITPTEPKADRLESAADNNASSRATDLREVSGQLISSGLTLPSGDQDWFKFTLLAQGETGNVFQTITGITAGTLLLSLYRASNLTTPIATSNTGLNVQELSLADLPAGTYYVKISSGNSIAVGDYAISITAPAKLQPDSVEGPKGNNGVDSAFELGNVAEVTGRLLYPTPQSLTAGLTLPGFQAYNTMLGYQNGGAYGAYVGSGTDLRNDMNYYNNWGTAKQAARGSEWNNPLFRQTLTGYVGLQSPNLGLAAAREINPELDSLLSKVDGWASLVSPQPEIGTGYGVGYGYQQQMPQVQLTPQQQQYLRQVAYQQAVVAYQQAVMEEYYKQEYYKQLRQQQIALELQKQQYINANQQFVNQAMTGQIPISALWNNPVGSGGMTADSIRGIGLFASGLAPVAVLPNLSINTPTDTDWFHFDLTPVGRADDFARITYNQHLGALKLSLYLRASDGSLLLVEQSSSNTGSEEISLDRLQPGSYYVKIEGVDGATNPNYQLEFSLQQPAKDVRADWSEPANSRVTARDLRTIEGTRTFDGLNLNFAGDSDWFSFTTTATAQADDFIDVRFSEDYGDIDIGLYDASGTLVSTSTGTTGIEHLSLKDSSGNLLPAGKYYIRVFGHEKATNPSYQLTIAATGTTIEADAFENNNTRELATDLDQSGDARQLTGLTIQGASGSLPADEDWFKFTLASTGRASDKLWLDFDGTRGGLKIELYNSPTSSTPVATATTSELSLSGRASGTYYAKVVGTSTSVSNRYTLNYDLPPKSGVTKDEWTIFVYMTAGDLAKYAQQDINELEQAAALLPSSVNLVVLLDQSPTGAFATGNGSQTAWAGTGRAVIQADLDSEKIATRFVPVSGALSTDVNTGLSQTLTDFLVWGAGIAPANNYGLIFWNHGEAFSGSNLDTDSGSTDRLQISEMVSGINGAKSQLGSFNLQLISFDACQMQTVEVASALGGVAPIVIGSEELETSNGSNYASALAILRQNPESVTAQQLASSLVQDYGLRNRNDVYGADTLSAVSADSASMTPLFTSLKNFTDAVAAISSGSANDSALRAAILTARDASTAFSRRSDLRDLRQFLNNVVTQTAGKPALSTVNSTAAAAIQKLDNAILSKTQDKRSVGGMSIYWPGPGDQIDSSYLAEYASFLSTTGWGTFLQRFNSSTTSITATTQPDWAEANNTFARAFDLGDVAGSGNLWTKLSLNSAEDVDWFRFRLPKSGSTGNQLTVGSAVSGVSLTVALYKAADPNTPLQTATLTNGQAQLSLAQLGSGDYLLKILSPAKSIVSNYWLGMNAPTADSNTVVSSDFLGNHSKQKAHDLGAITNSAVISGQAVNGTTADWYSFATPRSSTNPNQTQGVLTVRIPGANTVKATLYNGSGTIVSQQTGSGLLTFQYDVIAPTTYFISVAANGTSASSGAPVTYSLQFDGAPTTINLSGSAVQENQPAGTVVGTFSIVNPEIGGTVTYALVGGTGSTDNSRFTVSGDSLKTAASFDYETKTSYHIRIRATDQGGTSYEKAFVISVMDEFDPSFTTALVSAKADGTQGDSLSNSPSISANGRYVAFESYATNLVSGDTNGYTDVFVKDLQTGTITRVSTGSNGTQGNSASYNPSISASGRYVTFESSASNLVSGDTNGTTDIFVKDLLTGTITRASVGSSGVQGNSYSLNPSVSADGRYVAFYSDASNLVSDDTNGYPDVFVKDLQTGTITLVSTDSNGVQGNSIADNPSISADGRYVTFESYASNLVSGDTNGRTDVFVKDLQTGTITRASTGSNGVQGNNDSDDPSISSDGRYVAFYSLANNLVSGDTNGTSDIFVKDLLTGTITRASVDGNGVQGNSYSLYPSISADGWYVAFYSSASNLVSGDTNGAYDVFVKDLQIGTISRVSVDSSGVQGNSDSYNPSISADGRYVAFDGFASNLVSGDTNEATDVFVHAINFAPTNLGLTSTSIQENQPVGTVVGTFTATDPNPADTFTYTLVAGTGSTNNASFTISGNQLQTAASFDYESKSSYSIRVKVTDQRGLSFEKMFTIAVTNINETPAITVPSTVAGANPGVNSYFASTAQVTGADSANFAGGELAISITGGGSGDQLFFNRSNGFTLSGTNVSYNGKQVGTWQMVSNTQMKFSLTAGATPNIVGLLLQRIYFRDNGSTVSNASRTVQITVKDGTGTIGTATQTLIYITNPPVITVPSTVVSANPGVNLYFASNAQVTDADSANFAGGELAISITGGGSGDQLFFNRSNGFTLSGKTVSYNGIEIGTWPTGTNTQLKFSLNSAATPSIVSLLLRQLYFRDNGSTVSNASRTVQITVKDGTGTSSTATQTLIYITNPPVITVPSTVVSANPGVNLYFASNAQVTDADSANFAGGELAISITGGGSGDQLFFNRSNGFTLSGTNVSYNGTQIGTWQVVSNTRMKFSLNSAATLNIVGLLLQRIYFRDNGSTVSNASRTVQITVNDGTGTSSMATQTLTYYITNPPVITVPSTVVGGNPGVNLYIAPTALVSDADSTNFAGGELAISITGGGSGDQLFFNRSNGFTLSGTNVSYNGKQVGTWQMVSNTQMKFSLTAGATPNIVGFLLQRIYFRDNGSTVSSASRTVQITVNDGASGIGTAIQTLTFVSNPPVVTVSGMVVGANPGVNLYFASNAQVTDADSANFAGGELAISITGGGSGDQLFFNRSNGFTLSGKTVSYNGIEIGTWPTGTNTQLQFSLNSAATPSIVSLLLGQLYFRDNGSTVSNASRTVQITVKDGTGTSSTATQTLIYITNPPVITLPSTVAGADPGVNLYFAPTAQITDADSANFAGGELAISITGGGSGDQLFFNRSNGFMLSGTNVSYNGTQIGTWQVVSNTQMKFSLNSAATPNIVGLLLQRIYFRDNGSTVSNASRTVQITVSDGAGGIGTATQTLTFMSNPPVVMVASAVAGADPGVNLYFASNAHVTDADSTNFAGGELAITMTGGGSGDQLFFNRSNGFTLSGTNVSYNGKQIGVWQVVSNTQMKFVLNSAATPNIVGLLLQRIYFRDNGSPASSKPRTIQITLSDGTGGASTATQTIQFNQSPVITVASTVAGGNPGVNLYFASSAQIIDSDSANFAGGELTISVTGGGSGDQLFFNRTNGFTLSGTNVSYNGKQIGVWQVVSNTQMKFVLNSAATPNIVGLLLQRIYFRDNGSPVSSALRTVQITVNDGAGGIGSATQTLTYSAS